MNVSDRGRPLRAGRFVVEPAFRMDQILEKRVWTAE